MWGLSDLLATRMTFAGVLRYASVSEVDAAVAAIEALLDGEDDDFAADLQLRRRELELRVRIDSERPHDWYLAYETLVETLAANAIAGEVIGEIDDTLTTYESRGVARATSPEERGGAVRKEEGEGGGQDGVARATSQRRMADA